MKTPSLQPIRSLFDPTSESSRCSSDVIVSILVTAPSSRTIIPCSIIRKAPQIFTLLPGQQRTVGDFIVSTLDTVVVLQIKKFQPISGCQLYVDYPTRNVLQTRQTRKPLSIKIVHKHIDRRLRYIPGYLPWWTLLRDRGLPVCATGCSISGVKGCGLRRNGSTSATRNFPL